MTKSKLENYESVLSALVDKPLSVDNLAYKCNMDCVVLAQRIKFLVTTGLVEQNFCKKKPVFALTRRGIAIYKTLTIAKRLEKLQKTVRTVDEALHALPWLSENSREKTRKQSQNENY